MYSIVYTLAKTPCQQNCVLRHPINHKNYAIFYGIFMAKKDLHIPSD